MARQINVSSSLRCRPLLAKERPSLYPIYLRRNTVTVNRRLYNFDKVFDQRSKNEDIFKALVFEKIDDLLQGYNVAFMTYGPSKTGKSHTMGTFYNRQKDIQDPGIIPKAIREIYRRIRKNKNYAVKVSFVEMVNEEVYDLLEEPTVQRDVRERETRSIGKRRWVTSQLLKEFNFSFLERGREVTKRDTKVGRTERGNGGRNEIGLSKGSNQEGQCLESYHHASNERQLQLQKKRDWKGEECRRDRWKTGWERSVKAGKQGGERAGEKVNIKERVYFTPKKSC
ncbi:kinesin-like protein KIN-5A [Trichonephila inaurata madagascariensis]|uniref:Kinesin-like protein KIN-5A n=1 Tax=Trichonephila inaurata madagascariensis TaxID=2747483 RepID=A0A8X6WYL5_9ARAC|nr:kinesin-like protein KIN-5A [Trichonephila inaurata madagascariensis]